MMSPKQDFLKSEIRCVVIADKRFKGGCAAGAKKKEEKEEEEEEIRRKSIIEKGADTIVNHILS